MNTAIELMPLILGISLTLIIGIFTFLALTSNAEDEGQDND